MFSQIARDANELSAAELDAIVGGAATAATHQGSTQKGPSLLVVIAIIAILIG